MFTIYGTNPKKYAYIKVNFSDALLIINLRGGYSETFNTNFPIFSPLNNFRKVE